MKRCGLSKVELRNDMPSGKVTDDLSDAQLNALAAQYGIEIVTINALGMFNLMDNPAALQQRAEALLAQAQAIHSRALVLCPHCSADDTRSEQQNATTPSPRCGCWRRCLPAMACRGTSSRWASASARCDRRC